MCECVREPSIEQLSSSDSRAGEVSRPTDASEVDRSVLFLKDDRLSLSTLDECQQPLVGLPINV